MQQWEQPTVLEERLAVVAEGAQIPQVLPQLEVPMGVAAGEEQPMRDSTLHPPHTLRPR